MAVEGVQMVNTLVLDLGTGKIGWYIGEKQVLGNPYLKSVVIKPLGKFFGKDYIENIEEENKKMLSPTDFGFDAPFNILLIKRDGPLMRLINSDYEVLLKKYQELERKYQILEQIKKDLEMSKHREELSELEKLKQISKETKSLIKRAPERRF